MKTAPLVLAALMAGSTLSAAGNGKPGPKVHKKILSNGMTVLVQELHTAPVVAVNAWVKAGSVLEDAKEKGLTHFIEHMLFKGTENLKVGELDRLIKAAGGYNNARTRYESTDFIDVLPSSQLEVGLKTMADALRHSTFDATELNREKQVVLEELRRGQDYPGWEAWNKLTHLAFLNHPYQHPIIGYKDVVSAQDRGLMVSYWDRYYRPSNLVLVVTGDVHAAEVMEKVGRYFGDWKPARVAPMKLAKELPQKILRAEEITGDIQTTVLVLGCHGPSELDKDSPALEVAVSILGQGLSSRLNKSVRERQKLVQSVSSGIFNGASPGLTYLWAELEPEQVTRAARAMWAEVEKMRASEVEVEELSRQRIRLEFSEAKERMSMEGLAGKLGYYETLGGDYRLADEQLKRMRAVTAADVRRVMKKYFRPENASLVVYRPASSTAIGLDAKGWTDLLKDGSEGEKQAAGSEEVKKEKRAKSVKGAVKAVKGSLEKCGGGFFRADLSNGLEVLIKPVRHTPLVCTHLVFKGGVRLEPAGLAGAFSLMSRLSLKGTKRKSAEQIAAEVDDLGAFVGPFSDSDTYGFSTQSLSSRFPQALALMAELILEPAYREDEFQKEKERTLKDIKDKKDSADEYLYDVFDELFFTHSPYSRPVEGTPETVKRIKPQDLDSLHERFLVPNNATLVLVGDLDPISALSLVEKNMGEAQWQKRALELPAVPREEAAQKSREKVEKLKKKQAHIMAGWLAPAPGDPDYFAFRLLNSVLGEGMNSRLFDEVRDKRGLCYTVYSFFDRGLDPGAMRVYVGTKPESEKQALEVVMQVVQGLRKNGVTREEMDSSKAYAKGVFEIARQDFGNEARIASQYEFWGLGVKLLDEFPGRIDAVTRADVQRVAQKYLDPAKATVAILRP